jgi:hypothetical protein
MPDCLGCLGLWRARLPELAGTVRLVNPITHPECPAHEVRVPIHAMDLPDRLPWLVKGFVKVAFAITPRLDGAPWVGVAVADLPHSLPATPVISGMGVHARRDTAIGIAAAEAVERYNVLFHHSRATIRPAVGAAEDPVGTAVATTHRAALRRATAECLERLAIDRLCLDGSAVTAGRWPAGTLTSRIAQAIDAQGLTAEVFTVTVLAGFWLCVVALIDPAEDTPLAVGTAGASSARGACHRAVLEAYGLWAASADLPRSPVTDTDLRLLAQLRMAAHGRRPAPERQLLASRPAMSASDIGTRLSDECGLHAVRVSVAA